MTGYRLTASAQADIVDILAWSESQFGEVARHRYERLIITALRDIALSRPGGVARPELGEGVHSWHLRRNRERARGRDGVVQRPRHFLIYRLTDQQIVVVGRVLHDAMELERHLFKDDELT